MRFSINPRFGNVRPFISINDTDNGAGGELKAGVVTYAEREDGTESYKISQVSGSARSDHAYDLVQKQLGNDTAERLVSDNGADVYATGTLKQNANVKGDKAIQPTPTTDPAAACAEVALNAPAIA